MKYSTVINKTPQTELPVGHQDMLKNNAGGYGFKITPQQLLERFLLIGTEGGTFYVKETKLTVDNARMIIDYIKTNGKEVVNTVVTFANENRAPKADTLVFVLTLAMTYGNEETKAAAYKAIPLVCKTSTQLFMLVRDIQNLRGWSRGLRTGVAKFYTDKTIEKIAYQLVKYRQREGFTHRDVLRLCHAAPKSREMDLLFKYAVGKLSASETGSVLIDNFDVAMKTEDVGTLVDAIKAGKLTWEMVPTSKLNDPRVLGTLLETMPLVALIRNLNRFALAGMTDSHNDVVKTIIGKFSSDELVKKSGIHPVNVVNYLLTYSRGYGFRGSQAWTPNQRIVDALENMFYMAIDAKKGTGKNILVGVDNSGSMRNLINNSAMNATQFANVLALTMLKTEPNSEVIAFNTKRETFPLGARSSLTEALRQPLIGGATDCAVPIVHALEKKTKYDAIIILTDNESWAGKQHGFQALEYYRAKVNPNVKIVEVASVSTPNSTFPSDDRNLLRVVGFDASVLDLIEEFLKD